jgi:hypothetical protein
MYKYHIYLDTCINNKHIKDHIELESKYKGELKLTDQIIDGETTRKIEYIPELNMYDRQIKEYWDQLQILIEIGLFKKV